MGEMVSFLGERDVVFAISKEETWLLRLIGINAFYLPYSTTKEVESFLFCLCITSGRSWREIIHNSRKSCIWDVALTTTQMDLFMFGKLFLIW